MRRVELEVSDAADRPFRPDLLFEAPLLDREGDSTVLLLPIPEHKWHVDPLAAWQATRYQIRILEAWRALPGNEGRWPIVLSVLFYHGLRRWTAATQLRDLFALPSGMSAAETRALRDLQPHLDDDTGLVGYLLARSALDRTESRGGHTRTDFPATDQPRHTLVSLADLPGASELGAAGLPPTDLQGAVA